MRRGWARQYSERFSPSAWRDWVVACRDDGQDEQASGVSGSYSAVPTKACLEDRGVVVGFAGENQITIPNSGDKLVGRELIAFVGPGFAIAFAKNEQAAKEVEATLDYPVTVNPEAPKDPAAQRRNAVYWWMGSERPAETAFAEIVGCLR